MTRDDLSLYLILDPCSRNKEKIIFNSLKHLSHVEVFYLFISMIIYKSELLKLLKDKGIKTDFFHYEIKLSCVCDGFLQSNGTVLEANVLRDTFSY